MGKITFIKNASGLNKVGPGKDHYSAMLFFSDTLPSGFSANARIKEITDVAAAETLGIKDDKSDETKATGGNVAITTPGAAGTTVTIIMDGITLGDYALVSGDDEDDVATGLRAAINNLTGVHGYSAAGTLHNVALTAPTGKGDSINAGTHLAFSSTGTGAATVTQFSGGGDAFFDVIHYHISEAFRINSGIKLWVGIFSVPTGAYDFTELKTIQNFAQGKIKNVSIFMKDEAFDTDHLAAIQLILDDLDAAYKPISDVLYCADITSITDLTTLEDLTLLTNEKVSSVIGQDGGNVGAALYAEKGYSISCIGAALGAVSLASVNENIGWRKKFNMAAVELETIAFANGQLFNSLSDNAIESIDRKNYIFLQKDPFLPGTFFNDSWTAVSRTNDFGNIEANRVMDKAIMNVGSKIAPEINGPVNVDETTGKLAIDYVKFLEGKGDEALSEMARKKELSGYKTVIDADQNVNQTSEIDISIVNVPTGVSRNFKIKISFASSI